MSSQFIVLTPPENEPVTLSDVRSYLRVDFDDDDLLISKLITRARSYAETVTGRALATQTIQQVFTIERPVGGALSGAIKPGNDWYTFNEMLGANPFGPAQFYFSLAMPPIQSTIQTIAIETKVTAFQNWTTFPLILNADGTYNLWIDNTAEPALIFFMSPVTSNFYRFTFQCGYDSSYPLPPDLEQVLFELCSYWYDNREGEDVPQWILNKLLTRRVSWTGL